MEMESTVQHSKVTEREKRGNSEGFPRIMERPQIDHPKNIILLCFHTLNQFQNKLYYLA